MHCAETGGGSTTLKRHLHSNTKFPKYKYKNTNMKIHTVETGGGSITGDILKYKYNLADTT